MIKSQNNNLLNYLQILFYIIFIISFFFMGALQFLGLSITISSYLLILCVALIMLTLLLVKKRVSINSYIIINICLLCWIVISGIVNHTHPLLIINYFSFMLIPVLIYAFVKLINSNTVTIKQLINTVILIQLPVLIFQYFYPNFIKSSAKYIIPMDRFFGTFPLAADHFLCFFLIMNIIYIGSNKFLLTPFNYMVISYSIICILLTNSLTSYLFLGLTVIFIFIFRNNKYIKTCSIILVITFVIFIVLNINEFLLLLSKPELQDITNIHHIAEGTAGRFQTFYFIFTEGLSLFGKGASSYYNPFNGGFQFNLNFSQLLWFYYDLGIIGLLFTIVLIASLINSFRIQSNIKFFLFMLVLGYSFSSTIFDQVSFLLTLNIFLNLIEDNAQTTKNFNNKINPV